MITTILSSQLRSIVGHHNHDLTLCSEETMSAALVAKLMLLRTFWEHVDFVTGADGAGQ